MHRLSQLSLIFFVLLFSMKSSIAQESNTIPLISLEMPDTLHKKRFWISAATGTVIYSGVSIGLWNAWYKNYDTSSFHFFNDSKEWLGMDKAGHSYITYNEARWLSNGARWTGMDRKKAAWTGVGIAYGLQMTIEIMDGFSDKWGFSPTDIAFNTLGAGLFIGQEYLWKEQRIVMKIGSHRPNYDTTPFSSIDGNATTTPQERADNLYGTAFTQRFLKDYNGQTIWLSGNIHSFLNNKDSKFPKWLNISLGYGAENMFAGFAYDFQDKDGNEFLVNEAVYPRYNQFFLSFDVDLTRIPTKSRFLQTVFSVINFIKIPAPALEYNRVHGLKFHPIYF